MTYEEIIKTLNKNANPKNVAGMARFGINPKNTLGVSIPNLRKLAREISKQPHFAKASRGRHQLALKLWSSNIHEARILAGMIEVPELVTGAQMDSWAADFDSWDVCDQVCMNLFDKTTYAYEKAKEWAGSDKEFVKRAGFALMACLAWHDKNVSDEKFKPFFSLIKKYSTDERNFVKKAVNWALRQIGKRSLSLREQSKKIAEEIIKSYPNSKSAKWVASDAIRELKSKKF